MVKSASPTAVFLAAAVALGCCKPKVVERVKTVEVKIPIAVPCLVPPLPEEPKLPIADLKPTSTNLETADAYAEAVAILKKELAKLRLILKSLQPGQPPTPR